MNFNNTIQNELKELNSLLAGVSNKNVYSVPAGYFVVLSHDILLAVRQPYTQAGDNNTVPVGYFDGLADSIMSKIKAGVAEDEGSAILSGLEHINVYRVPTGYFDDLATVIINKLELPAKVVVMRKRSTFFNYAAAAAITGIMGLSIFSVFDKKAGTDILQPNTETAVNNINNNFDGMLSTITDADIVNYLQNNGQDVNAALVASVTEDKNLPEQADYLTDDKTLDNLLNELKIVETTNN